MATSPLWSRGSQPLHSLGGNRKWPTCGQSGYVTPAVSGIPTTAERGGEIRSGPQVGKVAASPLPSGGSQPLQSGGGGVSEVAQLWAKRLRHPYRLGDPHHCTAGGQNQKWPACGQSGYVTPAVSGIPTTSEPGGKSEVAHKWAKWLRHPYRLGDPHHCTAGGQNQKWPACGQSGYVTPAVSGIPTTSEPGGKSEVAHKWAKWLRHPCRLGDPHHCRAGGGGGSKVAHLWAKKLRHPCRLGDPHHFRAGGEIRSGPQVGKVATSPLPSRGSPPLQSRGGYQKWPTSGQSGYVTPAVSGIPTTAERGGGGGIKSGPLVGKVATSPLPSRGSPPLQSRGGNQKWPTSGQRSYVTPAVWRIPTTAERGGGGVRSGPLGGKVATSALPSWGCPPLQSRRGNQKWPTSGQSGYVTPAVSGIPTTAEPGGKSEVAHLWAKWLRHPCRLGDPHHFRAGGEIRSGPQVGKVATSPLPSRGSPPLQSRGGYQKWPTSGQSGYVTPAVSGIPTTAERGGGGGDQKWPTCGQSGYVTPAVSGIPTTSEPGGKSEVAHLWAKWLRHPCRLGDPHHFRAGGEIRSGPQVGKEATSPLPSGGSPPLQSGGGGGSEVAHLGAKWRRQPCRPGDAHRFRAGGEIRSGPQVGKVATSPLPSRGSPPLQSRGGNQKWPTCGQSGYVTPAVSGIPTTSEPGGGGIKSSPLVGKVATSPLPSRGSPPLQSRGGNQKWPTSGQSGYVTPAVSGMPTTAERGGGGGSKVAHLWAKWLRHPCRLGDPHHFRAGGEIRSGPLVGKEATSPLPSRGSPPLHSGGGGGGDQK